MAQLMVMYVPDGVDVRGFPEEMKVRRGIKEAKIDIPNDQEAWDIGVIARDLVELLMEQVKK